MAAPEIAYRIALADPATIGGSTAQHLALLVATRWAQPDGRFFLRQTAIQRATSLSESTVTRAVRALQSAKVFTQLAGDEWAVSGEHLAAHDGWIRHTDGWTRHGPAPGLSAPMTDEPVPQTDPPVTDGSGRHRRPEPSMTGEPVPQTDRSVKSAAKAAAGPKAGYRTSDIASSPSSSRDTRTGEGEDARARSREAAGSASRDNAQHTADESFTDTDLRRIDWLKGQGVLLVNPATGEDLRREWLQLTVGLGVELVKAILKVRGGDYPSDFRKAAEPFATQVDAARRAHGEREATAVKHAREAASQKNRDELLAEEEARERGPYLEQARALLAEIAAADPRRREIGERLLGWVTSHAELVAGVAAGRVTAQSLHTLRGGYWARIRSAPLPPEKPAAAPPREPVDGAARAAGDALPDDEAQAELDLADEAGRGAAEAAARAADTDVEPAEAP